jgi:hypothetical protein
MSDLKTASPGSGPSPLGEKDKLTTKGGAAGFLAWLELLATVLLYFGDAQDTFINKSDHAPQPPDINALRINTTINAAPSVRGRTILHHFTPSATTSNDPPSDSTAASPTTSAAANPIYRYKRNADGQLTDDAEDKFDKDTGTFNKEFKVWRRNEFGAFAYIYVKSGTSVGSFKAVLIRSISASTATYSTPSGNVCWILTDL